LDRYRNENELETSEFIELVLALKGINTLQLLERETLDARADLRTIKGEKFSINVEIIAKDGKDEFMKSEIFNFSVTLKPRFIFEEIKKQKS